MESERLPGYSMGRHLLILTAAADLLISVCWEELQNVHISGLLFRAMTKYRLAPF
jgi:hypothetical protein